MRVISQVLEQGQRSYSHSLICLDLPPLPVLLACSKHEANDGLHTLALLITSLPTIITPVFASTEILGEAMAWQQG